MKRLPAIGCAVLCLAVGFAAVGFVERMPDLILAGCPAAVAGVVLCLGLP